MSNLAQSDYVIPLDEGAVGKATDDVSFVDAFTATYGYQYGGIADAYIRSAKFGNMEFDENFDPLTKANYDGYEPYLNDLAVAKNADHLADIKADIDRRLANKSTLEKAGFTSGGMWVASILDPLNVAFALPVFGQFGMIAKGGMTVRAAAGASLKGSAFNAAVAESVRAPFDMTNTVTETGLNLATMTAIGTIFGSAPAAGRGVYNSFRKGQAMQAATYQNKGTLPDKVDGVEIKRASVPEQEFKMFAPREPLLPVRDEVAAPVISKLQKEKAMQPTLPASKQSRKKLKALEKEATLLRKRALESRTARPEAERLGMSLADYTQMIRDDLAKVVGQINLEKQRAQSYKTARAKRKRELDKFNAAVKAENKKIRKQNKANRAKYDADIAKSNAKFEAQMSTYKADQMQFIQDRFAYNKALSDFKNKKRVNAKNAGVTIDKKTNSVVVDDKRIDASFDQRPWVIPEVEGATPFKERDFNHPQEWGDFLVLREIIRSKTKREDGESLASYVDRTNQMALDRSRSGLELKETPFTRSVAFKALSTPGKRIMANGTNAMKRAYHLLVGVDQLAMAGVEQGKTQHQSVARQVRTHQARAKVTLAKLQNHWTLDTQNRTKGTDIFGYNTDNAVAKLNSTRTFEEWFEALIEIRLRKAKGDLHKNDGTVSKDVRAALSDLDDFFGEYRLDLQNLGMLSDGASIKTKLIDVKARIAKLKEDEQTRGLTKKQSNYLSSLLDQEEYLDGLVQGRFSDRYVFPIYYDKLALSKDKALRLRLEGVFADWIRNNPIDTMWDESTGKFVKVDPANRKDPILIAKDAVAAIMEEGDPITHLDTGTAAPKGKHLRHRMIDIPEYLIKDFIVKTPNVLNSYATRVGKRMEFVRNFGNRNITEILDDFEDEMIEAGFSDKKIQGLRQDFLTDYERTMGEFNKSPDRWDNQTGRAIKSLAGMAYLDEAAIASVSDMGMMVLNHGMRNLFAPMRSEIDRALMAKAKASVKNLSGEMNELSGSSVAMRIVQDNLDGLQSNLQERIFNPIERAYYNIPVIGNGLGTLTYWFKGIDGVRRSHMYMDSLIKWADGTISEADAQMLMRYGFTQKDADKIKSYAKQGNKAGWEKGDSYIYANIESWPQSTQAERDLFLKWNTAMNAGVGNTIMHATSFDKPRILDGAVYVRYRPWMESIGLVVDERASSRNIKVARLESQLMTFPFQFMNFLLAATNRITAAMFDPMQKHRMIGATALVGLGYATLRLKNEDWWFDQRDNDEILQRSIEQSGITGIYGEIAYSAIHMAVAMGAADPETSLLKPKYRPDNTMEELVGTLGGAGGGLVWDFVQAARDMFDGNMTEAAEHMKYSWPSFPVMSIAHDWITED